MGHFINPKSHTKKASRNSVGFSKKTVVHKAKVLTTADVQANRSKAYPYLTL